MRGPRAPAFVFFAAREDTGAAAAIGVERAAGCSAPGEGHLVDTAAARPLFVATLISCGFDVLFIFLFGFDVHLVGRVVRIIVCRRNFEPRARSLYRDALSSSNRGAEHFRFAAIERSVSPTSAVL